MMMMMKSVLWWRKPEYPEETTDLRQVTEETFHTYGIKTWLVLYMSVYIFVCMCVYVCMYSVCVRVCM